LVGGFSGLRGNLRSAAALRAKGLNVMIGGNLSKWTMTYFAIAIGWLIIGEFLMTIGFGFPFAAADAPDTLVVVHIVCIGWLSMAMCGALFQFVPVLTAKPLFAEGWQLPALVLLTAGLVALLGGFMVLGGHLPVWLWLLPAAALLLVTGFGLVVTDLAITVWRARVPMGPAYFVVAGLCSLCATAALGSAFAWSLAGLGGSSALLKSGVPLHAIAGLGGWLTFTAMGVSYRLLAMFMLAPELDRRRIRATLLAGSATIGLVVVGGLFAIAMESGINVVLISAGLLGLATLALYGRDILFLYRSRKRAKLELNTKMAAWGFSSLVAAVLLAVILALSRTLSEHIEAFAFLVAFGWLSGLILAKLYKIVAFLTWLETYGPALGRSATPRVQDLVIERRAAKWFVAYFISVWSGTAALLLGQPAAFQVAALVMTVATLGIVQQLFRTRRLADVAGPLRLPNGSRAPHLLYASI
jgi:hypothetical protein